MENSYSRSFLLSPDWCGMTGRMSPLAPFTIFQALASEHAEQLGVGFGAMAARREFWLTVHTRVDFLAHAHLLQSLTGETWPEHCGESDLRCYRSYRLTAGDQTVAVGRTQWAVLGGDGKVVPLGASGFPTELPLRTDPAIDAAPTRFRDNFTPEQALFSYTVRSTDIDVGRHMNNVAYVRLLLGCVPAAELEQVKSMEVHYAAPCLEGEQLTVFAFREGDLLRLAVKRPDGHHAVLAAIRF